MRIALLMIALMVMACGAPLEPMTDAAVPADDAAQPIADAAPPQDGGAPQPDAAMEDASVPDAGQPDAGHDSGTPDAGTPDSGQPDAGTPDSGTPDAGPPPPPSMPIGAATQLTSQRCALDEEGYFWCWGRWGTDRVDLTPVGPTVDAQQVRLLGGPGYVEAKGSCAMDAASHVFCANFTALRMEVVTSAGSPLQFTMFGEGAQYELGCGVRSGELYCWQNLAAQRITFTAGWTAQMATSYFVPDPSGAFPRGQAIVLNPSFPTSHRVVTFNIPWTFGDIDPTFGTGVASGTVVDDMAPGVYSRPGLPSRGGSGTSWGDIERQTGMYHQVGLGMDCSLQTSGSGGGVHCNLGGGLHDYVVVSLSGIYSVVPQSGTAPTETTRICVFRSVAAASPADYPIPLECHHILGGSPSGLTTYVHWW